MAVDILKVPLILFGSLMSPVLALGKELGFEVGSEIEASESQWVDVVWFDNRFDYGPTKAEKWSRVKTRRQPVFPIVGFEIEASANAKPLKGSVANLNGLGPQMGVIVLTKENISKVKKRGEIHRQQSDSEIWDWLIRRTTQWVLEARPTVRIVVMTEDEVMEWAKYVDSSPEKSRVAQPNNSKPLRP